jgi:uncharacterized protein YukE
MSDTQLRIGAQTEAARLVYEAIEPIQTTLKDLGASLEAASAGFRGAAASGLGEAVQAWFTAAEDLLPTLGHYAQKLVGTDQAEARTESAQLERYARLADRLGGAR